MEETKDIKPLTPQGFVDTHKSENKVVQTEIQVRSDLMEPIPSSGPSMSGSPGPSMSGMSGMSGSPGPSMSGSSGPSMSGMTGSPMTDSIANMTGSIYTNMMHVDMLYNSLTDILKNQELTPLNLASTIVALMQLVEKYPKLSGKEKKEILLEVFARYRREHPGCSLDLDLLPGTIDMFVDLDKGEVTIKLSKQSLLDCLTCCLKTKSQK